ncbi:Lysophospholipase L1-like esterase [Hyella patelloides LEGE 07179]|uniref:Lysophospholipase L1-like esterase n=1 Tax=Hyella patelloides LEGE 07179 TaxID=945734 RepID=A0A563VQN3_9CYAN|nr:GDSL-type esterase/lipase family protein [Hyella patelloides]VEP13721.1 Lysophospholipase L1-like esterase [Hyella patelloides LEGE 07179]
MQTIISANSSLISSLKVANKLLSELESQTQQPLKIIAMGDSVVYGYGDHIGGGWVERLRRQWMSPSSKERVLYNLGVRGDRVSDVCRRLELEFGHRGELRNKVPDVILLSVGANDSPRLGKANGRFFTEFTNFQQQIADLLDLGSSLAPVLFVGMTPVIESKMPFLNCLHYNHLDQYRYKEATLQACQQRNIPYLDIFDLWLSRGEAWLQEQYSDDGLHPNVQGYENLLHDILTWQPLH